MPNLFCSNRHVKLLKEARKQLWVKENAWTFPENVSSAVSALTTCIDTAGKKISSKHLYSILDTTNNLLAELPKLGGLKNYMALAESLSNQPHMKDLRTLMMNLGNEVNNTDFQGQVPSAAHENRRSTLEK